MFELLDLLFNAGLAVGKALGITLFVLSDVNLPQHHGEVVPIEMSSAAKVLIRVRPKTEEERCRYSGVAVPYERLWEERVVTSRNSETVLPPEPGKLAGHALIINRKDCEGRPPEAMFRVATIQGSIRDSYILGAGYSLVMLQLSSMSEDMQPKWVPQVLEALEAAKADPVAQEFLRFNAEHKLVTAPAAEKEVENPSEAAPQI